MEMETWIRINPETREAAGEAAGALEIFREEARGLSPYLEGIAVNLADGAEAGRHEPAKSVRIRMDFRRGGRYLSEIRGRDWRGLLPDAASRAVQGARAVLKQRWELQEE
jgi:hypothetical protein